MLTEAGLCEQGPFEDPPVWEQIPNSSVPTRFWDQVIRHIGAEGLD